MYMKNLKTPAPNSRFSQLRILWYIHVYVSQEFLSLTENNSFRTSQLREAAERWQAFYHRTQKNKRNTNEKNDSNFNFIV